MTKIENEAQYRWALQNELVPFKATHPGEIIAEELDYIGMKRKDFAKLIGIYPANLSELLNGKRSLSCDIALKIEEHTELKAETLMRLQTQYELDLKRIEKRQQEEKEEERLEESCNEIV